MKSPTDPDKVSPTSRQDANKLPRAPGVIESSALLQGHTEVLIAHGGCLYTLRQTRQGKLILTK